MADRDVITFNPLSRDFIASPYGQYAVLRDEDPVHYSELLCGWILTRFDDVARVLRDPTVSSSIHNATPTMVTEIELAALADHDWASRTMVLLDDPDHGRIRRLMADPFRAKEVARLAALIERRVTEGIDALRSRLGTGVVEFDLIEELAYPLPVEIFSEWLGMPEEASPQFRKWTSWVARSRDPLSDGEREEFFAALDAMYAYLEEQADLKRAAPEEDLLSYLVHVDDGEQLTHEELMAQLVTLYMAGHEPTAGLVGNGIVALLEHPDQLELLRRQPDLVRNAVSELLRYDGPNQFIRRVLMEPALIDGVELPAGAVLYLGVAAANRDPRRWGATAEVVDVTRADAGQHLQLGAGIHACLGSHLARLQAQVFFEAMLQRFDGLELAGEPRWSERMFIRGMASLPLRCTITA